MKNKFYLVPTVLLFLVAELQAQPNADSFSTSMDSYLQTDANVEKIGNALERYYRKKQEDMQKNAEKEKEQKMEEMFKNPVKIEIGDSPVKGPANARVTVVEFSEFQCPYCRRGSATVDELLKAYPNDVKWVFKHLPLPFHDAAKPAAIASLAAHKQGKFWEMHDIMFQNQSELKSDDELFIKFAKEIGLNIEKFKADIKDPKLAKTVDDDLALGQKLGVRGTPGYFVNGVALSGAQPLPEFKKIVDRWLAEKK